MDVDVKLLGDHPGGVVHDPGVCPRLRRLCGQVHPVNRRTGIEAVNSQRREVGYEESVLNLGSAQVTPLLRVHVERTDRHTTSDE